MSNQQLIKFDENNNSGLGDQQKKFQNFFFETPCMLICRVFILTFWFYIHSNKLIFQILY